MIPGGVRAIAGKATGRFYFEAVHQYGTSPGSAIGVADATASEILGLGADTHGYGVYPAGVVYHSGLSVGAVTPFGLGDTVGLAVDVTSKLMWARVNAGVWNADPTADPGAGIGGISIAGISTVFPMCTVQALSPVPAPPPTGGATQFPGGIDGSPQGLARAGLSGAVDSPFITYSAWLKSSGAWPANWDLTEIINTGVGNASFDVYGDNGGPEWFLDIFSATGDNLSLEFTSAPNQLPVSTWFNLKIAIDTNHAAGLKIAHVSICELGGSETLLTPDAVHDTNGAFNIGFAAVNLALIGAASPGEHNFFVGGATEVWCAPGQFVDISDPTEQLKFRTAGGLAVALGGDGSSITGTAPLMYFAGAAADFTNAGTGGAFTQTGTALANAATNPY